MSHTSKNVVRSGLRAAAVLAALALTASACTSDSKTPVGEPLPGITADSVDVGYIIVDGGSVQSANGFKQADYGDPEKMAAGIQAVVDWVNDNGGAGGRDINAKIVPFEAATSSAELVQQLCADFTQDKKVFAVVLDGQYQNNTQPCYYQANTLMLDQTVTPHDQAQLEQYKNYLWLPTLPEYGSFLTAELETLEAHGFFEGAGRVQILSAGEEVARRVTDSVAKPWLAERGHTDVQVDYVDSSNQGTLGATSKAAMQSGIASKANRVITVGGSRILAIALTTPEAAQMDARFSMATVDNPAFVQDNPQTIVTERRVGMVGLGFNPPADVSTDKGAPFPDPDNPVQQQCFDIVTAAGAAPPLRNGELTRENWRAVLGYCDATLLVKRALDGVGEADQVTAQDFADGVAKIGDSLRSSSTLGTKWGKGLYAGTNAGRALLWDEGCECFDYTGDLITFPDPVAADVSASPAASSPGAATS
jgi:ABC-type branched-subunit amino acid transport system substrate-binding protein